MRRALPLPALTGLLLLLPAGAVSAQPDQRQAAAVEAILARSLLERAAFNACAALLPDAEELRRTIAASWERDLDETAELLSEAGHAADFITLLAVRFDLARATPEFSSRERLDAYCAMLGDWLPRLETFLYSVPQIEIRRMIGNQPPSAKGTLP